MDDIKFSVIMPCYNSEEYVRTAIESVIYQEYPKWELIIINDGSTDETPKIVYSYAIADKRISIFHKKNGGYTSAVNLGLEKITGDYFMMMGSDDRLSPDLFSTLIKEMDEDLPDLIAFRTIQYINGVSHGNDNVTDFIGKTSLIGGTVAQYVSLYPEHARILFIRDTSKCYKTSLLGDLRLFGKYGYDADGIFATLFARKAKSFLNVPIDGYLWTLRDNSVSAKTDLKKNLDRLGNWSKFFEVSKKMSEDELTQYEKGYAELYAQLATNTAAMIKLNDRLSINTLRHNIKSVPAVLRQFNIKLGLRRNIGIWFLILFPHAWIIQNKIRNH